MPGLVPGIHVFECGAPSDVDGRDEPGHDKEVIAISLTLNPGYVCAATARSSHNSPT